MSTLIPTIKLAAEVHSESSLVLPAREFIDSEARRVEVIVSRYTRRVECLEHRLETARVEKQQELTHLEKLEAALEAAGHECLKVERPAIRSSRMAVQQQLWSKGEQMKALMRPVSGRRNAGVVLKQRSDAQSTFLTEVLAEFPAAQIVDLRCLTLPEEKTGLPALTLFHPRFSGSMIATYSRGDSVEDVPLWQNLKAGVEAWSKRVAPSPLARPQTDPKPWCGRAKSTIFFGINYDIDAGIREVHEGFDLTRRRIVLPAHVSDSLSRQISRATGVLVGRDIPRVVLRAEFGDGFTVTSKQGRALVEQAECFRKFDNVLLLAEVPGWKVEYLDCRESANHRPKIEGWVAHERSASRAVVIGIKECGGATLAVTLGELDAQRV